MTEEKEIKSLLPDISLDDSDSSILYNLILQVAIVSGLMLVFYIYRTKLLWLYSPNTLNREKHPAFPYNKRNNWYRPTLDLPDSKLLPLIGLDSFIMLQTMKLLYRICFYCGVITIPPLCGIYYLLGDNQNKTKSQIFLKLSILNVRDDSSLICVPIFLIYVNTLLILYLIYLYYKKFIVLRQSYLRKPALSTSIITIKKVEYETGTLDRAYDFINIGRRTLYFTLLPSFIKTHEDLRNFIEKLGLGEIEDVELIQDLSHLTRLSYEREMYIRQFEKKIHETFKKIKKFVREKNQEFKSTNEIFKDLHKINPDAPKSDDITEKEYRESEKIRLFNVFMTGFGSLKEKKDNADILDYYFTKIKEMNKKILKEKERIDSKFVPEEDIVEVIREENPIAEISEYQEEKEFLPFKEIISGEENSGIVPINLPNETRNGFVTFKSQHNASAISQSLISSRPFSVSAKRAPSPRDAIWYNLNLNVIALYFTRIYSYIAFIIFNISFLIGVIFIAGMAKVEYIESLVGKKLPENLSFIKGTIDGILTPFIYNQMLNLSSIVIAVFLRTEGIISYSELQLKLMHRYFVFLFFNGFIAFIISSSFFSVIVDLFTHKFDLEKFSEKVSSSISATSVFFLNFSIQRCLTGNFFLLTKPVNLFINFFLNTFRRNRTRREVIESQFPGFENFAVYYPAVMLIFPICIIYLPIAPVALVVGGLHFFLAYLTMKNDFIHVSYNDYEAGGVTWNTCVKIIIYSLLTLHLTMFCQIFVTYSKLLVILVTIPFFLTIYFAIIIHKLFHKATEYHPISMAEEEMLDNFLKKSQKQRDALLNDWVDTTDEADQDSIELKKLDLSDKIETKDSYPYKDIMMHSSYSKFFFPYGFFRVIKSLESEDKDNKLGLKK